MSDLQPRNESGQFVSRIRYPVTDTESFPDIVGILPSAIPSTPIVSSPERKRDYSREAPTGNSTSYNLRRLSKKRPDLYAQVKAGEIKPKTAMREAGLITPEFSIPVEPQGAARRILSRFQGESLLSLIRVLSNHAGYDLTPREGAAQ